MKIAVAKESRVSEKRVSMTPEVAKELVALGAEVWLEAGAGVAAGYPDERYRACGVSLARKKTTLYADADLVCWFKLPADPIAEMGFLSPGTTIIGFLDPFKPGAHIAGLRENSLTALALELLPQNETTQGMDALAAMSRLAGEIAYRNAVASVARRRGPDYRATVLVIGSGNTALSAIRQVQNNHNKLIVAATSTARKRWLETEFAARFVALPKLDRLDQEQVLVSQQRVLYRTIATHAPDIVITTARRHGQRAPLLLPMETLNILRPGAVIEDLTASIGGNTAVTKMDETVVLPSGILVRNRSNYPSQDPGRASRLYGRCLGQLLGVLMAGKDQGLVDAIRGNEQLRQALLSTSHGQVLI